MTIHQDPNNQQLKTHDELFGYQIESILSLDEINAFLYRLVHRTTGTHHIHISTQDKENTFGVTFKTVPTDSTGVAHILEHTVLCGSEKYPVRDPFFSMLKRSLSTFMNAFTASDWTMYPFSTQNEKDFYNLMDVYLDAAFFPKIDALSFKQEGHRLEIERNTETAEKNRLVYKGVVYNEMKGAMSSPDQVMSRAILNALYPDTTYSNNSGGEPEIIPQLTHQQLKAFHQRHYHPSNAYFYTYGNLPLEKHLKFIADKIMKRFSAIDPKTDVPSQPRWNCPRKARYTYALAPNEDPSHKSQVSVSWLISDIRNTFDVLVFSVIEQVLIGNAGSPLRKALMDSGLGSALSDATGFDADNRDTLFSCGLKNTDETAADQIEVLIFDILKQLVREGIPHELVDSAIHQIEFSRKEITNTPYPYGLKLLFMIVSSWLHGGYPERILQLDDELKRLKENVKKGAFLEQSIQSFLIDNPHRVRLVLTPDQQKAQKEEEKVTAELQQKWEQLTKEACQRIDQDAQRLQSLQDSEEDISCLPTLALSDIPPDVSTYAPTKISQKVPLWCYDQPTSGIFYLSLTASAIVAEPLLPLVPFFCYAFTKMGTRRHTYIEIARRIDATTGGLGVGANARAPWNQSNICLPLLSVNAKCLARNIEPMLAIVEELIADFDFSDLNRLEQILREYQTALESMIVHNGHRLAISLASRAFQPSGALAELWGGVHHIRAIRSLSKNRSQSAIADLAKKLGDIAKAVFSPENVIMSAVGEPTHLNIASSGIESSQTLTTFQRPKITPKLPPLTMQMPHEIPSEGWSTSTTVAFVASTRPTVALGHPDAPPLTVLSKILRALYLHREIREKGGAYGGFAIYNPESGIFSLASYRDPHIARTLNVFAKVPSFIHSSHVRQEDIKEAVLQICSEIDKPDPPGPAARKAFSRLILGLDDLVRKEFKTELLQVTPKTLRAVAEKYFTDSMTQSGIAAIAGEDQLLKANLQLGAKKLTINSIFGES